MPLPLRPAPPKAAPLKAAPPKKAEALPLRPARPTPPGLWSALIYGLAKKGKTLAALRCDPHAYGITAAPRSLAASLRYTGVKPDEHVVGNLSDAAAEVKKAPKGRLILVDDVGVMAERTKTKYVKAGKDGWDLWGAISGDLLGVREAALDRESIVIFTFHERAPEVKDGVAWPGAPLLPSTKMSAVIPHVATTVVRAVVDGKTPAPLWKGGFDCDPLSNWLTGDRWGVAPKRGPQNLREIVVGAAAIGWDVVVPPRPPGLEWMDEAVDFAADLFAEGTRAADVAVAVSRATPGVTPMIRSWITEDAYARWCIRKASVDAFAAFADVPAEEDQEDQEDSETEPSEQNAPGEQAKA